VSLQTVKTASRDQKQTSQTPAHQPKTARQHLAGEPENKKPGFFRSLSSLLATFPAPLTGFCWQGAEKHVAATEPVPISSGRRHRRFDSKAVLAI
jgi:hypothetical protein